MSNPMLVCSNVTKTYREGDLETEVLKGVTFEMGKGELVAILGASGSGKSTLMHILGALDDLTKGEVIFEERAIAGMSTHEQATFRNQRVGFIYQFHHLLSDFTALENVAMPLMIAGMKRQPALAEAEKMLIAVNMKHRMNHRPSELSGGERQRVAIARALVNSPALVLADEPTGNLDHKTALEIYELMRKLNQAFNIAFLVVTHDRELAMKMDRQLFMQDGRFDANLVEAHHD